MDASFPVVVTVGFLHDLFTVIWIGGMITLAAVVLPAVRKNVDRGPQRMKLLETIQSRLSILTFISIVGLLVTGMLLSRGSSQFQGLFNTSTPYALALAIKHVLVVLMIILALVRRFVLSRPSKKKGVQEKAKVALLLLNMVIGPGVIFLSAYTAAL